MNPVDFKVCSLTAGAVLFLFGSPARAADQAGPQISPETTALTTVRARTGLSPVETFRRLLKMSPSERLEFLTNYPAATRERIVAKVEEYQLLPPPLAEMRLQVTELRWYLRPLLTAPLADREARLQSMPEPYRSLVAARLQEWDLMPPGLKDEVLEYETTMHYFVGHGAVVQPQMEAQDLPSREFRDLQRKLARWQALPLAQRQQMYGSFQHFFGLNEDEKQQILETMSPPERQETENLLDPIEQWPKSLQEKYVAAFREFSNMSPEERQQFMRSAERWQKLSEPERQAWRDLVNQLSNLPYPPGFTPPMEPRNTGGSVAPAKTNPIAFPVR